MHTESASRLSLVGSLPRVSAVAAVALGTPVLLYRLAGRPWPAHAGLATARRWLHLLVSHPTAGTWHSMVAACCWLAWLWLSLGLLLEAFRRWRGRGSADPGARVWGLGPGRRLAAWGLGPLMLTLAATPARAPVRAPVQATASVRGVPASTAVSDHSGRARLVDYWRALQPRGGPVFGEVDGAVGGSTGTVGGGVPRLLDWVGGAAVAILVEHGRRFVDRHRLDRVRRLAAARRLGAESATPAAEAVRAAPSGPALSGLPVLTPQSELTAQVPPAAPRGGGAGVGAASVAEVEVRLLGPVEIAGAVGPFDRPKTVETVVYLALNPGGVAKARWAEALWPDRRISANSLNTALWNVRRALGVSSAGSRHFPASGSARLALAGSVTTDVARFEQLAAGGGWPELQEALGLVRGRLFGGLGDPDWLVLDGHASRLEGLVARVALDLGEMALECRDPATAAWAARRGLLAAPYDERLYRLAMRAACLEGNAAAVPTIFGELCRVLEVDPGSPRGLSAETVDLVSAVRAVSGRR